MDNFTVTSGTDILTFSLQSSPIPNNVFPGYFQINNFAAIYDGVSVNDRAIAFYTSGQGGAFQDAYFQNVYGAQYFVGDVSAPTFVTGVYTFNDGAGKNLGTITISSATPEPSSLLLLGTAILGLAGIGRRRFFKL